MLIPYRDRPSHLQRMLPITAACLRRSGADFSIFILEQVDWAPICFTASGMHDVKT